MPTRRVHTLHRERFPFGLWYNKTQFFLFLGSFVLVETRNVMHRSHKAIKGKRNYIFFFHEGIVATQQRSCWTQPIHAEVVHVEWVGQPRGCNKTRWPEKNKQKKNKTERKMYDDQKKEKETIQDTARAVRSLSLSLHVKWHRRSPLLEFSRIKRYTYTGRRKLASLMCG
jgi:hypothetical protein